MSEDNEEYSEENSEESKFFRWTCYTLVTLMLGGVVTWAGSEIRKVSINENEIKHIKKDVVKIEAEQKESRRQVKALYWLLIKKPNIVLPKELTK